MSFLAASIASFTPAVLLDGMVPDLDSPVRTARDENLWMEVVPLHSIHCHAVGIVGLQELAGVSLGALGNDRKLLIWTKEGGVKSGFLSIF